MKATSFRALIAFAAVLAVVAFVGPSSAWACGTGTCCTCDGNGNCVCGPCVNVTVTPIGENQLRISLDNYITAGMQAQVGACIAGFGPVKGIESVNSLSMIDMATGESIAAYNFGPHEVPGYEFAQMAFDEGLISYPNGDQWTGFFTGIAQDVSEGIPVSLQMDVTLQEETNLVEFISSLQEHGILGTGSGHEDGTLDGDHYELMPMQEIDVSLVFPGTPTPEPALSLAP